MKIQNVRQMMVVAALCLFVGATQATAQITDFAYQGKLTDSSVPANGSYDFEFKLFDAFTGGVQQGSTIQRSNVQVASGVFTVLLDFSSGAFPGANRFLEIGVRLSGSGSLVTLAPRQPITPTPYAIRSISAAAADTAATASTALNAASAINATNAQNAVNAQTAQTATNATNAVNAQTAQTATNAVNAQTAQTATNATNAANATNATNATTAQNALQLGGVAASQFVQTNDGRLSDARTPLPGSASYLQNTTAQQALSNFNISGNGTAGGTLSGNIVTATTQFNIGVARVLASPGSFNFFAGNGAGQLTTTGSSNSFFGVNAGVFNATGGSNAFFGFEAGRNNNSGANNSYFGKDAGRSNNTGNDNAFFGNDAGQSNTSGASNAFFGKGAGADNSTATGNSFFGALSGNSNTTGANNSFFGFESGKLTNDAFNNSFFGYQTGQSNVIGLNNSFFGFTAGKLNTGSRNSYFGSGAGQVSTGGFHNSFFGGQAGGATTTGDDNSFFGLDSGLTNTTGSNNTLVGANSDVSTGSLSNAAAIGANAFVGQSNTIVLGSINGVNGAIADTKVGIGTTTPLDPLHVSGTIRVTDLGTGGTLALCHNFTKQISTCSSSLRYKTAIAPFMSGLKLVDRLKPISFNWKAGGMRDLGLGAEDVAAVEPLLVTYNDKGEVEGVKYDRVAVVLLNAVKQQQEQIKMQLQLIRSQQVQLNQVKQALARIRARPRTR